ncbi:MAG: tRNA preQ1(34) S-adenosylmethionine ribosyltransferase-isomerase QueA [Alphaproteobacteria bacterium]|nr:tRNA preQ1(34) S-adenosylmethionine ribosyltransferase-isomerase QueA [Alphaproteobacteria bacterium]MBV8548141.1 tRNA preQ1(34) S-adenosylmethionine ribosyltransferase-isomerase QueA [Alphaproteobacteria bacterium]
MTELLTADFDFDLPPERIAQAAVEPRDHARLLHVRADGLYDHHVYDLPDLLQAGDVLVVNDTKVIPARIYGRRGDVAVEVLLHKKHVANADGQIWRAFARPGKRLKAGDTICFADDFTATIVEKLEGGEILLHLAYDDVALMQALEKYGEPPLPPYIHREQGAALADRDRYQTVYARHEGSVAAPTAGLHFTPELLERLRGKGIEIARVTLHVGAGTFLPVKAERLSEHKMHAEYGVVTPDVADQVNAARKAGRRIVAVGTTALRLLESAAGDNGDLRPFAAETSIFIYPGYRFKIVDALMTNFHLPQSTLFMLVSAFAGMDRMRQAYAHAISSEYRFYSYGDASLLEKA